MQIKISFITSMLLFAFIFNACKKYEITAGEINRQQTERFFQTSSNISTQLKNVVDDIKKQNDSYKFIPSFSKKNGFPVWDKVVSNVSIANTNEFSAERTTPASYTGATNPVFFIPLKIPDGQISSYIVCLKSDSGYRYKFYSKPRLENALATSKNTDSIKSTLAELLVIGFFEKTINKKDSVLFNGSFFDDIAISIRSKSGGGTISSVAGTNADGHWDTQVVTVCYRITTANSGVNNTNDGSNIISVIPGSGGGSTQVCYDRVDFVWVSTGGGYNGGGTGGGGVGSGSGGIGNGYQCPPQQWWCEIGEFRIVNGSLYTPDNFPGKKNNLQWLWWESSSNYQNWQNHDIGIINDLSTILAPARTSVFWLVANPVGAEMIKQLLVEDGFSTDGVITSKIVLDLLGKNLQASPYNTSIENIFNQYLPATLAPSATSDPFFWAQVGIDAAFNKIDNPDWSALKCFWEAMNETVHGGLDMAGLVPIFGEVADLTNGLIYAIQGNGTDALFSIAAAIPIAGWASTAAKYARKTIYALDGTKRTLKWFKRADGLINFGNRDLLRKVLGLSTSDARIAHHILPWKFWDHPLIQKLAKSKNSFHLNERYNGIALNAIQHAGSHEAYSTRIFNALEGIRQKNLPDDDAFREIKNLIDKITTAINNNPNTAIDNIIF
jgi:A nuclease family of the HNH/ENDO VII superfamily with conserved AHH